MIRVCFHGAESTGKSSLARALASEWNCPLVAEYGRTYAETVTTRFTMDDLLVIARTSLDGVNQHDSNLITLHRVRDFRSLALQDVHPRYD